MVIMIRHVKQAFQNIGRNAWMSAAAVAAMTLSLFLLAVFVTSLVNANKLAADLGEDVSIRAYIDLAADEKDIQNLEKEIKSLDGVAALEFSSKDQELEAVQSSYGDAFLLFEGDNNPLSDVFIVYSDSVDHTSDLAQKIEDLAYISEVNYGGSAADSLFNFINNFRLISLLIAAILLLVSFFLIANTIRVTIFSRREEIEIMKLVGATNWYIRWPYIIEGMVLGLLGSMLAFLVVALAYYAIFNYFLSHFATAGLSLLAPMPYLLYLAIGMLMLAMFVGVVSSSSAIKRFLKV